MSSRQARAHHPRESACRCAIRRHLVRSSPSLQDAAMHVETVRRRRSGPARGVPTDAAIRRDEDHHIGCLAAMQPLGADLPRGGASCSAPKRNLTPRRRGEEHGDTKQRKNVQSARLVAAQAESDAPEPPMAFWHRGRPKTTTKRGPVAGVAVPATSLDGRRNTLKCKGEAHMKWTLATIALTAAALALPVLPAHAAGAYDGSWYVDGAAAQTTGSEKPSGCEAIRIPFQVVDNQIKGTLQR